MKKCFSIVFVVFLFGCSSDDPKVMSIEEFAAFALAQFDANSAIGDDVIIDVGIITGENFESAQTANNRNEFIGQMRAATAHVYNAALPVWYVGMNTRHSSSRGFEKLRKYLLPFPSGYIGPNPGSGALDLLEKEIQDSLDASQGNLILLKGLSQGRSLVAPLSINFQKIKFKCDQLDQEIKQHTDVNALDDAIEDILSDATPEEEVFVGLLLPAVNAARESSAAYDGMCNDLFIFSTPQERKNWDRDVRRAAFLIAVDFVISSEYDPTNESTASFDVNRQIFDAIMIMTFARAYDEYK